MAVQGRGQAPAHHVVVLLAEHPEFALEDLVQVIAFSDQHCASGSNTIS